MKTKEISRIGRLTKGVRLMRLDDVRVVSVARADEQEEEEISVDETAETEVNAEEDTNAAAEQPETEANTAADAMEDTPSAE